MGMPDIEDESTLPKYAEQRGSVPGTNRSNLSDRAMPDGAEDAGDEGTTDNDADSHLGDERWSGGKSTGNKAGDGHG